jgi:hypothetical protein
MKTARSGWNACNERNRSAFVKYKLSLLMATTFPKKQDNSLTAEQLVCFR